MNSHHAAATVLLLTTLGLIAVPTTRGMNSLTNLKSRKHRHLAISRSRGEWRDSEPPLF